MEKKRIKWLEIVLGTGFGTGFIPVAPATWASGLALLLFFILPKIVWLQSLLILLIFFLGVYLSGKLERIWGKDANRIVIDEICGIFISLFLLPFCLRLGLSGFLLFRVFDIVKPPPIRRSQALAGGWGVMIDDLLAGIYTNIALRIVIILASGLLTSH